MSQITQFISNLKSIQQKIKDSIIGIQLS